MLRDMASMHSHMAATNTKEELRRLILPCVSPSVNSATFLTQGPTSTGILTTKNSPDSSHLQNFCGQVTKNICHVRHRLISHKSETSLLFRSFSVSIIRFIYTPAVPVLRKPMV